MKYFLKTYSNFGFNPSIEVKKPCNVFIDSINENVLKDSINILLLIEPMGLLINREQIFQIKNKFNYILTHDSQILKKVENSILCEFGTSWIKDFKIETKKPRITTLINNKKWSKNHFLRHDLLQLKEKNFPLEIDFFNSINSPINRSDMIQMQNRECKNELFYSQYHICVENVSEDNWFTEKIIDCFQTKTVPIYYGCPNIDKWFDPNGIIKFNSIDELIKILNQLNENTYHKMEKHIEKNYLLSNAFVKFDITLENKLRKLGL